MKFTSLISLAIFSTAIAVATPIKIKDTKGREITVTILNHTDEKVTFEKDGKKFTVPWQTFDEASIKLIKATPLPGAANKRPERTQTITNTIGKKIEVTVPAGEILSKDGVLDIYLGDTIHLEFEKTGGSFTHPKVVATVTKPEQTITLDFQVTEDGHILTRTTQIQQTVAFNCYEMQINGKEFFKNNNFFPTEKGQKEEQRWLNDYWHLQLRDIEVTTKTAAQVFQERNN